jgi:hypothetical protein
MVNFDCIAIHIAIIALAPISRISGVERKPNVNIYMRQSSVSRVRLLGMLMRKSSF